MANILDYLDWRGDLTLAQDPFNEVDNLILAELSFVDFGGIVPGPGEGRAVPLWKAAEAYFAKTEGRPIDMGVLVPNQIPELLRRTAASPRFRADAGATAHRLRCARQRPGMTFVIGSTLRPGPAAPPAGWSARRRWPAARRPRCDR